MNLRHQYVKALPVRHGARPTSFNKFHGLRLKLIVNYVTFDILPNNVPLLIPLIPPRAPGCLAVVVKAPLIDSRIVDAIVYVPLFCNFPLLPLVVTVPFIVSVIFLY